MARGGLDKLPLKLGHGGAIHFIWTMDVITYPWHNPSLLVLSLREAGLVKKIFHRCGFTERKFHLWEESRLMQKCCTRCINTLRPEDDGWQCADHICNAFTWMKWRCFYWNCTELSSWRSSWQLVSTGSGHGLAPNWRQAITWSNGDQDTWRHVTSLGCNELQTVHLTLQWRAWNRLITWMLIGEWQNKISIITVLFPVAFNHDVNDGRSKNCKLYKLHTYTLSDTNFVLFSSIMIYLHGKKNN